MTKKRVSKAIDHIRGEVTASEYKNIVFPMLSLQFLEESSYYTVSNEAKWSVLIKSGHSLLQRVNEAIKIIEEENPSLSGVLSIFPSIGISDTSLFKLALDLDGLKNQEEYKEAAEEFIEHVSILESSTSGQFQTPQQVNDLMIKILNVDNGSFYDGTAGFAQTMITAAKNSKEQGGNIQIYGQEINHEVWAIGKMNLLLHGHNDATFVKGDTIREPLTTEFNSLQTFDFIGMNAPFAAKLDLNLEEMENDLYGRFRYGTTKTEMAFILHAIASLNENGRAALVVPHGVLFRGGTEGKIREELINADIIEGIVGLPPGLFSPYTNIATAILILNKNKVAEEKGKIFMLNMEEVEKKRRTVTIPQKAMEKVIKTYHEKSEVEGYSKWITKGEIIDNSLLLKYYFEESEVNSPIGVVKIDRQAYEKSTETVPLKSLGEFYRGLNIHAYKTQKEETKATHKMIQLSNVNDGQLIMEEMEPYNAKDLKKESSYEARPGDIIISSRGHGIKIAVIPETNENLMLSQNFIGFRPYNNVDPYFIKAFLESPVGTHYLALHQKGTAISILKAKDIEGIPVPALSLEEQRTLAQKIAEADSTLKEKIQKAKAEHTETYLGVYKDMGLSSGMTN